jgi:hypothetical protein
VGKRAELAVQLADVATATAAVTAHAAVTVVKAWRGVWNCAPHAALAVQISSSSGGILLYSKLFL